MAYANLLTHNFSKEIPRDELQGATVRGTEFKDACQEPGSRRSCSASRTCLMLLVASHRRCDQGPLLKNRGIWAGFELRKAQLQLEPLLLDMNLCGYRL
jgi:hypothetical protein